MKVKELIEKLNEYPEDTEVVVQNMLNLYQSNFSIYYENLEYKNKESNVYFYGDGTNDKEGVIILS